MSSDRRRQRGAAAIPTTLAVGFLFLLMTLFAQFAVWQYGRGAVRSAAQDGVRAGAVLDAPPGSCEAAASRALRDLLGGSLGSGVGAPRCAVGPETVSVTIPVRFERWLPISPDWQFDVEATAVREREPE